MRYSVIAIVLVVILGFLNPVYSQTLGNSANGVSIIIIPENPKPNQTMTATVQSYVTDINSANITWKIDGSTIKDGIGEKIVNFKTKGSGFDTQLDVQIVTKDGEIMTQTMNISPSNTDLIWQSEGFVPPFYKGKVMFAHQNKITFIAIPHILSNGKEINPKNLIYKWTQNGKVLEEGSGYGKNTLTITGSIISRSITIEVEVSTPNSSQTSYAQTTVTPTDPTIVFYEKDPLYGIQFQKAIAGSTLLDSPEIDIVSIPLFFGVDVYNPSELSYKWYINGTPINNDFSEYEQIFRQKEGVSGVSKISLKLENSKKVLQFVSTSFNLSFGNNNSQ